VLPIGLGLSRNPSLDLQRVEHAIAILVGRVEVLGEGALDLGEGEFPIRAPCQLERTD
jgi:hypothetical protein